MASGEGFLFTRRKKALREVYTLAKKGYKIAHIVDGPKGPRGVVKPGLKVK
jgi:lysophospholipid acyltransferase (LPLAT)-like uncharacterized protein